MEHQNTEKKFYFFDGKKYSKNELENMIKTSVEWIKNGKSERAEATFKMLEGKEILDVGCASGSLAKLIAQKGYKVHAIDVLESSIEIAKDFCSYPNVSYEVRDVIKQQFPENSFDCVIFLETIEHVENPAIFLKEFHRILKPGGCVIISTPNATSLKNILYALSYRKRVKRNKIAADIASEQKHTGTQLEHVYNWDFPVLLRLLDRCGFEHVDHVIAGSGPVTIPIFGKKVQIIKDNSKILKNFEPLKSTHIIKARKRSN